MVRGRELLDCRFAFEFELAGVGDVGQERAVDELAGRVGGWYGSASTVTYDGALASTTVEYALLNASLKESLVLASASAPASFDWTFSLSPGLSIKSGPQGSLLVVDTAGTTMFVLPAPSVADASGAVGPAPTMTASQTGSTWDVHVEVDSSWLGASDRAWPVTVDPTIEPQNYNGQDASISPPGGPSNTSPLYVGVDGTTPTRLLLSTPNLGVWMPWDAVVTSASMSIKVTGMSNGTAVNVGMYPLTRAWDGGATWTTTNGTTDWTNAGGDYNSAPTDATADVTADGWYSFSDTGQIAAMSSGASADDGFLFKEVTENQNNTLAVSSWQDSNESNWPYMTISYTLPTGQVPSYSYVAEHQLSDNSSVAVNPVDGDVVYQVDDSDIAGVGLDEDLVRTWDSQSASIKDDLGYGWSLDDGADTTLNFVGDTATLRMFGNAPEVFEQIPGSSPTQWTAPPGFDTTLSEPTTGNYTLTFDSTQQVWKFGDQSASTAVLLSEADRNGDTITFHYSCGSGCPMTSITDTEGRTTSISENGNGYITSITDPTFSTNPVTRSTGYSFANPSDPNQLTGVTDADGHSTSYTYDSYENLTQIDDADGNITTFNWGATPANHQIQSITYGEGTSSAATWTFAYNPSSSANGGSTSVTDPDGHTSVYDYNNSAQVTSTTNPLGQVNSTAWNSSNSEPSSFTDATTPGATTNLGYDSNNNLSSVQLPASGSDTPAKWTGTYNAKTSSGGSVTGNQYLPSQTNDPQNNCQTMQYDPAGNLTNLNTGMTTASCTGTPVSASAAYDGDGSTTCTGAVAGEMCSQTDPNGKTTSYTYDAHGNLATISPPSPLGQTSYTYDGASRVATVKDGDANNGEPASIVAVQSATTNITSGDVSSVTVTLPSNVTAGDALVVVTGSDPSGSHPTVSSVSGGGVTWTKGVAGGDDSVGDDEIWYGLASSGGSGTTTITVNMNGNTDTLGAWVGEFTGVASSSALDTDNSTTGTGTTVSTPSMTTTKNGDLIIAGVNSYDQDGSPPGSPWTDVAGPEDSGQYDNPIAYRTLSTAGSVPTATWAQSPSGAWATAMIALKPAASSTAYTYDNMDRVKQILYGGDTACVPSSGNCIQYGYDNNGNLTSLTDNTGTTTWTYDPLGRVTLESLPSSTDACSGKTGIASTYDAASNLTSVCDAGGTTNYTYDAANNNTTTTEPGGTSGCKIAAAASSAPILAVQSATTNITSENVSSVTVTLPLNVTAGDALVLVTGSDPSGSHPTVSSVSGGGVTWSKGVAGGDDTVGDDEIWYGLDSSGGSGTTTITVTMTGGTDDLGAWLGEFSGVASTSALDTDAATTGTGTTVSTPSMTASSSGDLVLAAVNSYWSDSNPPSSPWTDVAGPEDPSVEYDNPIAYRTMGTSGAIPTTSWTQAQATAWATTAVALKPATKAAVSQNLTSGCTAFAYDNDDRRTTTQFPGGATESATYIPSGRIASIGATTSSASTITHYAYTYNQGSQDTSLVQTRAENDPSTGGSTVTTTYSYDHLNRLTEAAASSGTSYYYTYDNDGNRTCAQTSTCSSSTYTYNNADELTSGPAGSYTYDADGNELTSPQLSNLSYNSKNQTSSITKSGTTYPYIYTGADSTKRTSAGSTTYAPDGGNSYESSTSGTATYYTYDGTGDLIGMRTGGSSYYYLHDNVGSVVAVISSTGSISDRYSYDPYGNQTVVTSGVSNPIGYAGGYEEPTGLVKFGTRYYDPATARFTQVDPDSLSASPTTAFGWKYGLMGGSRYEYAGDDPIVYTDPTGRDIFSDIGNAFSDAADFVGDHLDPIANGIDCAKGVYDTVKSGGKFNGSDASCLGLALGDE